MTAQLYPAPGHTYNVNFGDTAFRLEFHPDAQTMTFTGLGEALEETHETIHYTAVPVRPNVFMVYWQEANKTTVVHVQDFENQTVHTNITTPDQQFYNLSGTMTRQ
jgi:hypothetical protein